MYDTKTRVHSKKQQLPFKEDLKFKFLALKHFTGIIIKKKKDAKCFEDICLNP